MAEGQRPNAFTVLDWVGVVAAALPALFLLAFPVTGGAAFRSVLDDFGGGTLPALTTLATSAWFPPLLGGVPLVALVVAVVGGLGRWRRGARRGLVVAAFLWSLAAVAVVVIGVYLPVFQVAGAVRAE